MGSIQTTGDGDVLTAVAATAGLPGQAVYSNLTGALLLARADAYPNSASLGLLLDGMSSGFIARARATGTMTLTTVQWDAVTGGAGGLTPGSIYWLSDSVLGRITTTAVSSGFRCLIGRAIDSTKMALRVEEPIKL